MTSSMFIIKLLYRKFIWTYLSRAVNYDDTFQVYCAESSNTNRQYAQNKAALALSYESVSDTSSSSLRLAPNLRVAKKRKRKFDEMVKDRDSREDLKAGELEEPATLSSSSRWERVETRETLPYSRQTRNGTRGFKYRYRCDLCYDNNKKHVCDKEGDMKRHLQSIDHSPKSFTCTNSGCGKAFTRKDGLKRHRSSCRHDTSRSTSWNRGHRRVLKLKKISYYYLYCLTHVFLALICSYQYVFMTISQHIYYATWKILSRNIIGL